MKLETKFGMGNKDLSSLSYTPTTEWRDNLYEVAKKGIEKTLYLPLKDLTSKFAYGLAKSVYSTTNEMSHYSRKEALEYFEQNRMKRQLKKTYGNITKFTREVTGTYDPAKVNNLRRNWYRKIEKFGLQELVDGARPAKETRLEEKLSNTNYLSTEKVEKALTGTLNSYKELIHPKLYDDLSSQIKEKAPIIAETISPYIPTPQQKLDRIMKSVEGIETFKEAKKEFEKQIVYDALSAAEGDKKKAAKYLGNSLRTLNRKISELNIVPKDKSAEDKQEKAGEDAGKVIDCIDRFRQLQKEQGHKRSGTSDEKLLKAA